MSKENVVVELEELITVAIIMFEHGDASSHVPSGIRQQVASNITAAYCYRLGVNAEEFITWINKVAPMTLHERVVLKFANTHYGNNKERSIDYLQEQGIEQKRATELVDAFSNT